MLLSVEDFQRTWTRTGFEKCKRQLLELFKDTLTEEQLNIIRSLKED